MVLGTVPLLTRGPFALFLGGVKMLEILVDAPPGKALGHLSFFTFIFQVCISAYKKYRNMKQKSIGNYLQNLRQSLVENVLNIYSLVVILVINIIFLMYLLR